MVEAFDPYHKWLGIPPEEQPANHYRLLGIRLFEDDPEVIDAVADQRMRHLRAYQTGEHGELSQRLLNEVAAARVCLLDNTKEAAYDAKLRQAFQPEAGLQESKPVDPELASLFQKADGGISTAGSHVAARKQQASLNTILGLIGAGALLALGLLVWGLTSGKKPSGQTVAAGNREPRMIDPDPQELDVPCLPLAVKPRALENGQATLTNEQIRALKPVQFARVKVHTGGTFEQLSKGTNLCKDKSGKWSDVPGHLAEMRFLQNPSNHQGVTEFEIEGSGILLLAVNWGYGGGSGKSIA